jgi:hypothetical protein
MEECTLKMGESPHTLMRGNPDKKYILGIDPNMSDSPNADYFAMAIMEYDEEKQQGTLVHTYAGLGNLKNHVNYLNYIIKNFNIVFMILDNAGADTFLAACNESNIFKQEKIEIKTFDIDSDLEGVDYDLMIKNAKNQYNLQDRRIAFNQVFTASFIRKANEYLQACIDYKRVWFASRTASDENSFNETIGLNIPLENSLVESRDS